MKLIHSSSYTDAVAESLYSSVEKELSLFADVQGIQHGTIGKPKTEVEFRALFLNKIELHIQGAIAKNQSTSLVVSGAVVARKCMADAEAAVKPLSAALNDAAFTLRTLREQKKDCTPDLQKRRIRRIVYFGAGLIAITEGVFAYPPLRYMPLPAVPAFITAVAIAIALGFGTHIFAGFLRKATSRTQFIVRCALTLLPVFIGFFILGDIRANGYDAQASLSLNPYQNAAASPGVSGMSITILSFLLFAAALLFSFRFYKTAKEHDSETRYEKACDELQQCEKSMQEMRQTVAKTKENALQQSAIALGRYEYAVAMEHRLQNLGRQVVQEYIHKNMRYRSDDAIPTFFAEPPALRLKLFFDNQKRYKP